MPDIFISYASEDRTRAKLLAEVVGRRDWSVWWDRKIPPGKNFDEVINHALDTAKCVIVLWSRHSVKSDWVKEEAEEGARRGILIPVLIEDVEIPLGFRRRQTARLSEWRGDADDPEFLNLTDAVAAILDQPQMKTSARPAATSRRWWHTIPGGLTAVVSIIAGVSGLAAILLYQTVFLNHKQQPQPPNKSIPLAKSGITPMPATPAPISSNEDTTSDRAANNILQSPPGKKAIPSEAHGINNPLPLELGVLYTTILEQNEESYFRLSSPASNVWICLDMRRMDNRKSNLMGRLSVLDEDGGVIQEDAIDFNEIDVGYRKTAFFSSKQPAILGFKLLNKNGTAKFGLTVLPEAASKLLPFFGEVVPKALALGEDTSAVLDTGEDAYYITSLPKGDCKVILTFSNSNRKNTNIQGYLALLDPDGGNQRGIIGFNEINVSYRKIARLSLKKDQVTIVRIQNQGVNVNYTVKIVQDQ